MASILKVKSTKKTHLDIAYKYKYAVKNLYELSNFLYKFVNRPAWSIITQFIEVSHAVTMWQDVIKQNCRQHYYDYYYYYNY